MSARGRKEEKRGEEGKGKGGEKGGEGGKKEELIGENLFHQ